MFLKNSIEGIAPGCNLIGVQFAEPQEYGGRSPLERSQEIDPGGGPAPTQRVGSYFFLRTVDVATDAIVSFDCDDDACLLVLLVAGVALSILLQPLSLTFGWLLHCCYLH